MRVRNQIPACICLSRDAHVGGPEAVVLAHRLHLGEGEQLLDVGDRVCGSKTPLHPIPSFLARLYLMGRIAIRVPGRVGI